MMFSGPAECVNTPPVLTKTAMEPPSMATPKLPQESESTKRCTKCGALKPVSEFGRNGAYLRSRCKPCRSRDQIEWQRQNNDKHNEKLRRWRAANPEKSRAITNRYYQRHTESRLEANKRWCEENRELRRDICRAWGSANRHKKAEYKRRREARQLSATPPWADKDKMWEIYEEAARLTTQTGVRHEVDHIVPLMSKVVCGLHCEANLRIVLWDENRSKGNRFLEELALAIP